ncbi:hypothetical protein AGMMS49936_05710 [Endomicrobiia bacterium]|nr:hypothetical protein AGMMS49936_05710 [Endomicrobiia bacterium]
MLELDELLEEFDENKLVKVVHGERIKRESESYKGRRGLSTLGNMLIKAFDLPCSFFLIGAYNP